MTWRSPLLYGRASVVPIVRMAEVGGLLALLDPALLLVGGVMLGLGRLHLPGDLVGAVT
jgi:hypothetical protein